MDSILLCYVFLPRVGSFSCRLLACFWQDWFCWCWSFANVHLGSEFLILQPQFWAHCWSQSVVCFLDSMITCQNIIAYIIATQSYNLGSILRDFFNLWSLWSIYISLISLLWQFHFCLLSLPKSLPHHCLDPPCGVIAKLVTGTITTSYIVSQTLSKWSTLGQFEVVEVWQSHQTTRTRAWRVPEKLGIQAWFTWVGWYRFAYHSLSLSITKCRQLHLIAVNTYKALKMQVDYQFTLWKDDLQALTLWQEPAEIGFRDVSHQLRELDGIGPWTDIDIHI